MGTSPKGKPFSLKDQIKIYEAFGIHPGMSCRFDMKGTPVVAQMLEDGRLCVDPDPESPTAALGYFVGWMLVNEGRKRGHTDIGIGTTELVKIVEYFADKRFNNTTADETIHEMGKIFSNFWETGKQRKCGEQDVLFGARF